MRLSLRTILAYTDNLFDAEYRRAVEKRIGEEGVATYLIDRIRAVVRNSDMPVPGRHGEKEELSANLVAAYLDNRLSDIEQAKFETICLRSEIYLAEIACTHQILTTILGQPAKLDRDCRLRLYAIPRHRKAAPAEVPLNHEYDEQETVEPQVNAEIEPQPHKKRRITVTAQEASVMQTIPSPEPQGTPPEQLASPVDQVEQSDQPAITAHSASDQFSRLGQAFAHRKRHRQITLVSSLVLLLVCVSTYMIAHRGHRQSESEVTQDRQPATASSLTMPDDEKDNDRRFDEQHSLWGYRDTVTLPTGSGSIVPAGGEMVARVDSIYSMHEPPGSVMQYLPGNNGMPSQVPRQIDFSSNSPSPFSQSNLLQPTATPAISPATVAASSQMAQSWPTQPTAPIPPVAQPNPMQQPYSLAGANMPNTPNTPVGTMAMAGNAPVTAANNLSGNHNQSNAQFAGRDQWPPMQSSPRHPESTIQLIDPGNVPSVNQYANPTLPAVQPATWGPGSQPENSSQNTLPGANDQVSFPHHLQTPSATQYSATGMVVPGQSVEQASYTPNPRQPNQPPPLIEPIWNEPRNDSFEQVPDIPRGQVNHAASPPLRLPENYNASHAGSNNQSPTQNHRLVSNRNIANSGFPMLLLSTEDIALIRDTPDAEWSWLPVSRQLVNDIVLVPAPFRAVISFPNGIVVETEGDTRVQIMPDDEAGRPTLAFDCGHLTIYTTRDQHSNPGTSQSMRIVTPVGGGVLRLTDTDSFVTITSENKTTVKLLKVTRPYESVTANPMLYRSHLETNVVYCPNVMTHPADGKTIYWHKDGNIVEWELGTASIFPIDNEKNTPPILLYNTTNLIVAPTVVWPSLVSHDGRIPISKLDLKNQFVTMPHTFYPTPSKTWLLK